MSDLISKKALIKVIETIDTISGNDNSSLIEKGEVLDLIEEIDTVDAEPVRHGSWVPNEKFSEYQERYTYICSECGEEAPNDGYDCGANFCPRCGAKMTDEVSE